MNTREQHRLSPGPLLNEEGDLAEAGYAYQLVKKYDRSAIKAPRWRIKEWDYYLILDQDYALALTIDDNGYMGLATATVLDFRGKRTLFHSPHMFGFPMGKVRMPATSETGNVSRKTKTYEFRFLNDEGKRRLTARVDQKKRAKSFECDVSLALTTPNSTVIATPFLKKHHFYYNQKINLMQASGWFRVGTLKHEFSEHALAVLDWGRGVWTYRNTWHWSSMNAFQDGTNIGWNLGYGFGDTSHATENMFFVGKDVYKLGDVRFDIPLKDGKDDFMSPWRIVSDAGDVDMRFTPLLDRHEQTDIGIIGQNAHQVFGRFSGTIRAGGKDFAIKDLLGFAEKVHNKW